MLIAGDVGGTKTVLAFYESKEPNADGSLREPLIQQIYASQEYPGLEAIIAEFLNSHNVAVKAAAFGVAGPVVDNVANATNLGWLIDGASVAAACGLSSIQLLNDLTATANAIPVLPAKDLHCINPGKANRTGPVAVIAPGTGLGEAFLTHDGVRYRAHPSEGGHAAFSPSNELELNLLRFLFDRFDGHVSTERVCSGSGIPNIYDYYHEIVGMDEPTELAAQLALVKDRTPIIVNDALSEAPHPITLRTIRTFAEILASETADLVLQFMATGGVYLGGGMPPRILQFLDSAEFRQKFFNKGRFTDMMPQIPVNIILNDKAALLGAARAGFEALATRTQ